MARNWSIMEHPSDLGLVAQADSLAELLKALGEGLAEQICSRHTVRPVERITLTVKAENPECLAREFLNEVLLVCILRRFVAAEVEIVDARETAVSAVLAGEPYDPARHELGPEIKAVTYHQLKVAREGGRWIGRVLLDL